VIDNQETEVKLYVPDLRVVEQRLQTLGAHLSAPRVFERNVRYEDEAHTLTPRGVVLRLRQDSRTRLTYKESGAQAQGIVSRLEVEVEVGEFAAMEMILGKLGFHPALVYEKYRTTYALDGAEVVLDEMPYGNFVEIEGEHETIERLISRLELNAAPRIPASYTALFEHIKQALKLEMRDLTFANFAGVDVPDWLIRV
jgi:adenylate cyclase class 2